MDEPIYRGILGIDIESPLRRDNTDVMFRNRLGELLDRALSALVGDFKIGRIDTIDGVLLWLDLGVSPRTDVLTELASRITRVLARINREAPASRRLRIRMVLHRDLVRSDPDLTDVLQSRRAREASALLNTAIGRSILRDIPEANAVLLVSEQAYQDIVSGPGTPPIDQATYYPIHVTSKGLDTRAWVHLPSSSRGSEWQLSELLRERLLIEPGPDIPTERAWAASAPSYSSRSSGFWTIYAELVLRLRSTLRRLKRFRVRWRWPERQPQRSAQAATGFDRPAPNMTMGIDRRERSELWHRGWQSFAEGLGSVFELAGGISWRRGARARDDMAVLAQLNAFYTQLGPPSTGGHSPNQEGKRGDE